MAKKTKAAAAQAENTSAAEKQTENANAKNGTARRRADGLRETIESVVIAFVLAFLFRTFVAEAFVIPTGSMASTLLGRHKDVTCTNCGFEFTAGASAEANEDGTPKYYNGVRVRIVTSICPNCRYTMDVKDDDEHPSYKGDRILVNKFAYMFADPKRWDVFVFRYPEEAQTNYIKRHVGGNGELIKLKSGDLLTADLYDSQAEFEIAKKPHAVAKA